VLIYIQSNDGMIYSKLNADMEISSNTKRLGVIADMEYQSNTERLLIDTEISIDTEILLYDGNQHDACLACSIVMRYT
jgi:hypothetical protein